MKNEKNEEKWQEIMQRCDQKGKTGREIREKEGRKIISSISFSCNQNKFQENGGLSKIFNVYFLW